MSGGKSDTSSAFGDALAGIAEQINKEVNPVRKLFLGQLKQILSGNQFTNSTIPLIQSGVKSARQAAGFGQAEAQSNLAKTGTAQSPFAAAILSMQGEAAAENIGNIPGQVAEGYLGQVGSTVTNIGGQALSGLANAAQTNYRTSYGGYNIAEGINALLG